MSTAICLIALIYNGLGIESFFWFAPCFFMDCVWLKLSMVRSMTRAARGK